MTKIILTTYTAAIYVVREIDEDHITPSRQLRTLFFHRRFNPFSEFISIKGRSFTVLPKDKEVIDLGKQDTIHCPEILISVPHH